MIEAKQFWPYQPDPEGWQAVYIRPYAPYLNMIPLVGVAKDFDNDMHGVIVMKDYQYAEGNIGDDWVYVTHFLPMSMIPEHVQKQKELWINEARKWEKQLYDSTQESLPAPRSRRRTRARVTEDADSSSGVLRAGAGAQYSEAPEQTQGTSSGWPPYGDEE